LINNQRLGAAALQNELESAPTSLELNPSSRATHYQEWIMPVESLIPRQMLRVAEPL